MSLFKSIWDDLKYSLQTGNMVTKLVVVNFAVFVLLKLIYLALGIFTMGNGEELYSDTLIFFCLQSDPWSLLLHPWGIVTHMFLHDSFWHMLLNMCQKLSCKNMWVNTPGVCYCTPGGL